MESCFGFVAIFLILDASIVFATGNINLGINVKDKGEFLWPETHKPQPVTRKHIAPNRPRRSFNLPVIYTSDFVFPTENYPEVDSSTSSKLQESPANKCSLSKMKAERKCDEYAREVEIKTGINCTNDINSLSACFVDNNKYPNNSDDLFYGIILGEEAKINEFPHMVALGKHNPENIFTLICGGTLISHTWILSAAHCTHGANGGPSHARLGFHKLSDQNVGVTIGIKRMIRHPDYKPPQMYADIALIKLVRAVMFSASIRPACLYQRYASISRVWISGWGVTEFAGEHSDPLLKAKINLINKNECKNVYKNVREFPYGLTSSTFCVGDLNGDWRRDTCQGDSGGPVQNPDDIYSCLFRVIGITSLGLGCAMNNTPGVYTKVSSYTPWIANIVWPYK